MARLIDAAKLEKELDEIAADCEVNPDYRKCCFALSMRVGNEPVVDAVEVVRCKDCKHSTVETKWNGKEYCACNWKGAEIHEVDECHYCSYGERREGNETD